MSKGEEKGISRQASSEPDDGSSSGTKFKKSFFKAVMNYGTIVDDVHASEALPCVQERGSVYGILNDVSLNMGGYVCLTFTMLVNLPTLGRKLKMNPCDGIKDSHLSGVSSALCEYCEVYVLCFPLMTFTITLLVVGRDILHKRLYYRLLLERGVLRYRNKRPMHDFLILMSLWSFAHVCMYVCFLCVSLFNVGIDPKRAFASGFKALYRAISNPSSPGAGMVAKDAYKDTDPEGFTLLVHILCFVIVPGLFYLLFIFRMYPVDWTLVPLSEYISQATAASEELNQLVVIEEFCAKAMLEDQFDSIIDPSYKETHDLKGQLRYVTAIKKYQEERWDKWIPKAAKKKAPVEQETEDGQQAKEDEETEPEAIDPYEMQVDLLDSLWPASLVLTNYNLFFCNESGKIHWFAFTWAAFITTTFGVGIIFISYPVMILIKECMHLFFSFSYQAVAPLAATILHLATASLILHRVFKASPAWSYVRCCHPFQRMKLRASRTMSLGMHDV